MVRRALRRPLLNCGVAVVGLVLAYGPTAAQDSGPREARVMEAALFKNGLGFVTREFEVPGAGEHVVTGLPVPAHGTFWILPASKDTVLKQAVAFSRPEGRTTPALTLVDLLRANVGKQVQVKTEPDGWVSGTLVAVPEEEPSLPVSLRDSRNRGDYYGYDYYSGSARAYRPPDLDAIRNAQAAAFVLLKTSEGMLALATGDVKGVRCPDGDLSTTVTRPGPGAALRLTTEGAGGKVRIACLEWGLTWAPSYLVDVSDPQEASLQCKAEVLNDAEDLQQATVQFVTGFPNLSFAEVVSPLALVGDVSDFIQSLLNLGAARRGEGQPAMMQQAVMSNVALPFPSATGLPVEPGAGEVREDLFLYPQPDVKLARGERAYYPLFAKSVPYESLYRWEVDESEQRGEDWQRSEVWHVLRLTNSGGIPWTTAPAMTLQEEQLLGQDTLFYTAPGAKTLLKVTRAVDIAVAHRDTEVERKTDALTRHGRHFDLVRLKGELRIRNQKAKPITMLIEKTLSGDVLDSAPRAAVETSGDAVWDENPKRELRWELPVEAGGKAYVTYQYQVYVPR